MLSGGKPKIWIVSSLLARALSPVYVDIDMSAISALEGVRWKIKYLTAVIKSKYAEEPVGLVAARHQVRKNSRLINVIISPVKYKSLHRQCGR